MYYALSDCFTGDYPKEHTSGFANTKEPIAFLSKSDRDEWIKDTRLLTARKISYRQAVKLARRGPENKKIVRIAGTEEYHIIKSAN